MFGNAEAFIVAGGYFYDVQGNVNINSPSTEMTSQVIPTQAADANHPAMSNPRMQVCIYVSHARGRTIELLVGFLCS